MSTTPPEPRGLILDETFDGTPGTPISGPPFTTVVGDPQYVAGGIQGGGAGAPVSTGVIRWRDEITNSEKHYYRVALKINEAPDVEAGADLSFPPLGLGEYITADYESYYPDGLVFSAFQVVGSGGKPTNAEHPNNPRTNAVANAVPLEIGVSSEPYLIPNGGWTRWFRYEPSASGTIVFDGADSTGDLYSILVFENPHNGSSPLAYAAGFEQASCDVVAGTVYYFAANAGFSGPATAVVTIRSGPDANNDPYDDSATPIELLLNVATADLGTGENVTETMLQVEFDTWYILEASYIRETERVNYRVSSDDGVMISESELEHKAIPLSLIGQSGKGAPYGLEVTIPKWATFDSLAVSDTDWIGFGPPPISDVVIEIGQASEVDKAMLNPEVPPQEVVLGTALESSVSNAVGRAGAMTLSGRGQLEIVDEFISIAPEMRLVIRDKVLHRAPTAVTFTLAGGMGNWPTRFYIDNTLVWVGSTDSEGGMGATSISVFEAGDAKGSHVLEARQSLSDGSLVYGSDTYVLQNVPEVEAGVQNADAQAVIVPGAEQDGFYRWVFQDLRPIELGGIGSYVFPHNPEEMDSPKVERPLTAKHTVAVDGMFHIYEASRQPKSWKMSGFCPTQEHRLAIEAYRDINRRFWAIDHRNRAWKVVFADASFTPRLRQNYNGQEVDGHDFELELIILDQLWIKPAAP